MSGRRLTQPGKRGIAAGDLLELRLPPATLFASRAQRLRQLAEGHSLSDYLRFVAVLAECQQKEFDRHPAIPLPDTDLLLARHGEQVKPPLAPAGWCRHSHWREVTRMLAEVAYDAVPASGRKAVMILLASDKKWLEAQADTLLAGRRENLNLATAPIIGAALQVQWTYWARQLQPQQVVRHREPVLCPVCGSHPAASVIRPDGTSNGLGYLHCALCGTEWHVVRAKCSCCENNKGIVYYRIEGKAVHVGAECCPACHSYLKVIHRKRGPEVDPVADDLATLALDLLMGEKNFAKNSVNFLNMQDNNQGSSFRPSGR